MGLVARELERRGVPTVCLVLLREVAEKIRPPRGLVVPFDWGQPLGPSGRRDVHEAVLKAALGLLVEDRPRADRGEPTLLRDYEA